MDDDIFKPPGKLRCGWTTGACAAAAAGAAVEGLLRGYFAKNVTIRLPGGERPTFPLSAHSLEGGRASATIIKDAGDDPDVTHGAEIVAVAGPGNAGEGVTIRAGEGIGAVTRPGLPVAVGQPAINPVPRTMIREAVEAVAGSHGRAADFVITIAIPGGRALAEKTMNGRLGIVGGLSVLGTTGIVRPYSCSAWINSIHYAIDVARASGLSHIAASTGKTSEAAVQELFGLADAALIEMGNFAGGLLKYLRRHPVDSLTIAGGFAKIAKLAQGNMDLHSARSEVDFGHLAACLDELGGNARGVEAAAGAMAVLDLAGSQNLDLALAGLIAGRARRRALAVLDGAVEVRVCVFDRAGKLIGRADG